MSSPLDCFHDAWARCDTLSQIHAYAAANIAAALKKEELLRAEWAARVAALDLYVHERVAQEMQEIFAGRRPPVPAFNRFTISNATIGRIRTASNAIDQIAAFDLEVRRQLAYVTYQTPDSIAEGIRQFSSVELWKSIVLWEGCNPANAVQEAKTLRGQLAAIVERRNKIVHEGDMQPALPRTPWPVSSGDLTVVSQVILRVVNGIEAVA